MLERGMTMREQSVRWVVGAALLLLGGPALAVSTVASHGTMEEGGPKVVVAEYVGAETCVACHDDVEAHMAETPHGSEAFAALAAYGCESCHGPGSLHADDPEVLETRPTMARLTPAEQSQACLTCHDDGNQFFWEGSLHDDRGVSCLDCHSVHEPESVTAQLKQESITENCLSCHKDVRAELWKTSHHPIREGQISCADCHNPHGSQTEPLLRAESVNEQCWSCHAEKRGPFIWEHPPVRESCLNCHTPHGSNHLKLQKTSVPYLCQQCHSNTRHPGTLYDANTLADAPGARNRIFNRACVNCHAAIHGSNHPASPYLGH